MPRSTASLFAYVLWWVLAAVGAFLLLTGMGWPIGLPILLVAAAGGLITRLSLARQRRAGPPPAA